MTVPGVCSISAEAYHLRTQYVLQCWKATRQPLEQEAMLCQPSEPSALTELAACMLLVAVHSISADPGSLQMQADGLQHSMTVLKTAVHDMLSH